MMLECERAFPSLLFQSDAIPAYTCLLSLPSLTTFDPVLLSLLVQVIDSSHTGTQLAHLCVSLTSCLFAQLLATTSASMHSLASVTPDYQFPFLFCSLSPAFHVSSQPLSFLSQCMSLCVCVCGSVWCYDVTFDRRACGSMATRRRTSPASPVPFLWLYLSDQLTHMRERERERLKLDHRRKKIATQKWLLPPLSCNSNLSFLSFTSI